MAPGKKKKQQYMATKKKKMKIDMHTSQCLFYTQTYVNYLSSSVRCHVVETVPGAFMETLLSIGR